ncbi:dihydrodipicolinate synthase family protein [Marinococcus sp. PL1-022]|uniref:dihydrodipicolinate synthase family protein n=1 Tax=Marinococcus sp. PL1-022 TaxID=3095363 RepID=UPI0029C466B9|nr:dihydrodipicolinate synthase family protein [Marinococcus sp. PL1-022]MDX6152550.1 dihydrodipicolinate synthase family protein [Marinococcus sp. PL1-022]
MLTEIFHVAVPTAFHEDESLNIQGTINHIKDLHEQGVKSVLVSGTTGEQHSLSLQEKFELVHALALEEELIRTMEIIFGVASIRQKEAEMLAEKISHTELSGIMLGYPPYVVPTQEEAIIYTKRIVHLSNKPAILYNNPNRTGFDLSENSIIQLSEIGLIAGIKEAGNKEKVGRLKKDINRKGFYFYAGGEVDLEDKLLLGYDRLSSIAGNVSPVEIKRWFEKMLIKQTVSKQENDSIEKIMNQVYQGHAVVNLKKIINDKGTPVGICRSPIGNV